MACPRRQYVADDDALLAEDGIDQGGFADVRPSDGGDARRHHVVLCALPAPAAAGKWHRAVRRFRYMLHGVGTAARFRVDKNPRLTAPPGVSIVDRDERQALSSRATDGRPHGP